MDTEKEEEGEKEENEEKDRAGQEHDEAKRTREMRVATVRRGGQGDQALKPARGLWCKPFEVE
eukprot:8041078-Pyramimonas_sp.AAC.1